MPSLTDALRALSAAMTVTGARWYVFGAQAVAVRGAPRATQDIDVTIDAAGVDVAALRQALSARGFEDRHPELADELMVSGRVLVLRHESGMDLDLVLAGPGLEQLFLSRATPESLAGVTVPVASATDLVVMKLLSGRGKDLDDVRSVLAGGGVDVDEARSLLEQLEAALGQSDLVPALDAALRDQR